MAKHSRKGKSELDTILDQLKTTYRTDSSDASNNDLLKLSESRDDSEFDSIFDMSDDDEDAELNELLNNLFSSEETVSKNESKETITEADEISSNLELDESDQELEPSSLPLDEVEADEQQAEESTDTLAEALKEAILADQANETDNITEQNETIEAEAPDNKPDHISVEDNREDQVVDTEACDQVDNVLASMLSHSITSTTEENHSPENENELSNDTEVESAIIDEVESEKEDMLEAKEDDTVTIEEHSLEDISDFEVSDSYEEDEIIDCEFEFSNGDDTDISESDEEFAIEDEEYDTSDDESEFANNPDTEYITEDNDSEEDVYVSEEPTLSKPRLILSPEEYTHDPLQNLFPTFSLKDLEDESETDSCNTVIDTAKINEVSFDNNDISLLLKFGYDNEVKTKVGHQKTQDIIIEQESEFIPKKFQKPFGYCGSEFSSRSQIPKITEKYKSNLLSSIILLVIVSMLTVFIISVDIFFAFFSTPVNFFLAAVFFEFLFILLICVTIFNKVISGMLGIVRFEPERSSPFVFLTGFYLIYLTVASIIYISNPESFETYELTLFGYCIALYAVSLLVADLLCCIREYQTFSIISSSDVLHVAEKDQNHGETAKTSIKSGTAKENNTYSLKKASLISGYFKKIYSRSYNRSDLIYLIGVVPILALICGGSVALCSESIMLGLVFIMLTTILCTPLAGICAQPIADFIMSRWLKKYKAAFISYNSLDELSTADTIIFKDAEAIEIKSCIEIKPLKSSDNNEFVDIAYRVFGMLGGPLAKVCPKEYSFDNSQNRQLIINEIEDNGIDIYYNGSTNLLIGDKYYMYTHKINVKTDPSLSTAIKGVNRTVIYVAFDGVPKIGFIINSSIKNTFADISAHLSNASIKVAVESYDPQVNNVYFEQNNSKSMPAIKVIKPLAFEASIDNRVSDSLVVSSSDSLSVAGSIALSREIISQKKTLKTFNLLISILGAILSVVLTVLCCLTYSQFDFSFVLNNLSVLFLTVFIIELIPSIVKLFILISKHKHHRTKTETNKQK